MAPDHTIALTVSRDQLEPLGYYRSPAEVSRHHQRVAGSKNQPEPLSSLNAMYDRRKDRIKTLICGARPKDEPLPMRLSRLLRSLPMFLRSLKCNDSESTGSQMRTKIWLSKVHRTTMTRSTKSQRLSNLKRQNYRSPSWLTPNRTESSMSCF